MGQPVNPEGQMTPEQANALFVANQQKLMESIVPLFDGYSIEEVVSVLLSISTQVAINAQSDHFKTNMIVGDDQHIVAEFTIRKGSPEV